LLDHPDHPAPVQLRWQRSDEHQQLRLWLRQQLRLLLIKYANCPGGSPPGQHFMPSPGGKVDFCEAKRRMRYAGNNLTNGTIVQAYTARHPSSVKNQKFLTASPRGKPLLKNPRRLAGIFLTYPAGTYRWQRRPSCRRPLPGSRWQRRSRHRRRRIHRHGWSSRPH